MPKLVAVHCSPSVLRIPRHPEFRTPPCTISVILSFGELEFKPQISRITRIEEVKNDSPEKNAFTAEIAENAEENYTGFLSVLGVLCGGFDLFSVESKI